MSPSFFRPLKDPWFYVPSKRRSRLLERHAIHAPASLGAAPAVPFVEVVDPVVVPEFGSAPPPAPPPASDEPLVPLVSVPELSPPVEEALVLPDVDVMLEPPDEVGEDIIMLLLELIMLAASIILLLDELIMLAALIMLLELIIMDEEAIEAMEAMEDAVAIAPDAMDEPMTAAPEAVEEAPIAALEAIMAAVPVGALVSRLATPLGPDSPLAAPPIPPWRGSRCINRGLI
ncbi:MAG: hypothetical protein L6R37_003547 [Teloschistes peruensis]|nr:MAG: hypothetical protein L6R37_003547 [Teloschistes peruensis]